MSEGMKIRMKNESEGTLIKIRNEAEARKIQLILEVSESYRYRYSRYSLTRYAMLCDVFDRLFTIGYTAYVDAHFMSCLMYCLRLRAKLLG
jgi:hypothetical protein